jgi:uncharacterized protein YecE (DUF72 family)
MLHIGTSGWQYTDWRGEFYPSSLPQSRWLDYYSATFDTVESNSAFYRLPRREVFARWAEQTPPEFVMAVKVSRYLTHIRRLAEPAEPVARFLDRARGLGSRLGPVLLQLPPTLRANADLLDATLREFPRTVRVVVEPRHDSWWRDEIRDLLTSRGAALCWADRDGRPVTPLWPTADFGYLRMHAGRASPPPSYGDRAIDSWLERVARAFTDRQDFYVYFNNDHGGAAVRNALTMARHAENMRGGWVGGPPAARLTGVNAAS